MFNWSPFDQNVTWVRWFLVLPRRARPSVASCCQLDGWQTASVLEQKVRQVERLRRMSFSPFHLEASWSNKSNDGSLMDRTFQHIRLGMLKCHWTSSIQPQHWGSTLLFGFSQSIQFAKEFRSGAQDLARMVGRSGNPPEISSISSTHGLDVVLQSFCPRELCVFSSDPLLQGLPLFTS